MRGCVGVCGMGFLNDWTTIDDRPPRTSPYHTRGPKAHQINTTPRTNNHQHRMLWAIHTSAQLGGASFSLGDLAVYVGTDAGEVSVCVCGWMGG